MGIKLTLSRNTLDPLESNQSILRIINAYINISHDLISSHGLYYFIYHSEKMKTFISKPLSRNNPDLKTSRLPNPQLVDIVSIPKRSHKRRVLHLHDLIWEREEQRCMRECCRIKEEVRASLCRDNLVKRKKLESRSTAHHKSTDNNAEQKQSRGSKDKRKERIAFSSKLSFSRKKKRNVCILPRLKEFEGQDLRDQDNETKHKIVVTGNHRRLMTEGCYDLPSKIGLGAFERQSGYREEGDVKMDQSKLGIAVSRREKIEKEQDEKTSVSRPYYRYIENYPGLKIQSKPSPSARHRLASQSQQPRSIRQSFQPNSKKDFATLFHQNKLKYSSAKISKSKLSFSTQPKLPKNQEEMSEFLIKYKSLSDKFDLKGLVKEENFVVERKEGEVYFGQMKEKMKEGLGILMTQKELFQGRFEGDFKVYGSEKTKVGTYRGDFRENKRHGRGEFVWTNGEVFQGEWKAGKKDGHGVWKSPKADFYEGQWRNNKQNGKGLFVHVGASTYTGYFKDFLKEGRGEEQFQNGDSYTGEYKTGKPHGYGRYLWKNGNRYEGEFVNGSREGQGVLTQAGGQIYQGSFLNDQKHGRGKEKFPGGEWFQGQFFQGEKKEGKLYSKEGHLIEEL